MTARRSLPQFLELMQKKSHCLAHPDALISAVGTKVGHMQLGMRFLAGVKARWIFELSH